MLEINAAALAVFVMIIGGAVFFLRPRKGASAKARQVSNDNDPVECVKCKHLIKRSVATRIQKFRSKGSNVAFVYTHLGVVPNSEGVDFYCPEHKPAHEFERGGLCFKTFHVDTDGNPVGYRKDEPEPKPQSKRR